MLEDMAPDNETANDDKRAPWGTLEELLLACAVNRHGTKRWDSIAMEVRSRRTTDLHSAFSPLTCRRKYYDLRRRFAADESSSSSSSLVDALRDLRVAELRREVQRRDVSIVSLQSKVKRLEEERERERRSLKEEEERGGAADLKERVRAGNSPGKIAGNSISGDVGSFDESNSTGQKCEDRSAGGAEEPRPAEPAVAVVPEQERAGSENRTAVPDVKSPAETMATDQDDGGESAAESKRREGTKPGSDVQSSASLSRRTKRRRRTGVTAIVSSSGRDGDGDVDEAEEDSPASAVEFQPLVRILEVIRSHKLGSALERRLRSQDTGRYKNLIRKHLDLATVQSRLRKGLYSDCHLKFYRDILLMLHNGVVFFRKNIPEHHAACELQALVSARMAEAQNQMARERNRILRPASTEPDAEVAAVARRRIGAPGKAPTNAKLKSESPNANGNRMPDKRAEAPKPKPKPLESMKRGAAAAARKARSRDVEKPAVSGKRSRIRRRRNGVDVLGDRREGSDGESISGDEPEPKGEKNIQNGKIAAAAAIKKRGAADFLKRMRQNSPNDKNKAKSDSSDSDDDNEEEEEGGRREGMRDRTRRRVTAAERREGGGGRSSRVKRAVGRPPKRSRPAAAEDGDGRTRKRPRWGGRGVGAGLV